MQITTRTVHIKDLEREILPLLRGRVFHVTTHAAFKEIQAEGAIRSDAPKAWAYNGYFRAKGYVAVCDLRSVDDGQLRAGLDRYNFLKPETDADPAFLFLAETFHDRLVRTPDIVEAGRAGLMVVPYIEVGFPSPIPLGMASEALVVTILDPPRPDDPGWLHLQALREGS
jgi:hypothetical protein